MRVYKLTNPALQTHNGFQWVPRKWREAPGTGPLCSSGWLHAYEHPLLAVLHNPIHGDYSSPRLWQAQAAGAVLKDYQMKLGVQRLRLIAEMRLPVISVDQRVAYSILAAWSGCVDTGWREWAAGWLSGSNRPARAAARAAARAETPAAAEAADAAGWAVKAARAAWAAEAAEAVARVAARVAGSVDLLHAAKTAAAHTNQWPIPGAEVSR